MRILLQYLLVQASLLLGPNTAAQAAPILLVTNGILMGAQGVELGGRQYDVAFSDTRPVTAGTIFDSFDDSFAASNALDRLVFQGVYDMSPARTNGCSSAIGCLVVTAYDIGWLGVRGTALTNTPTRYVDPIIPYLVLGSTFSQSAVTYAHWTVQETRQAVPEPSSLLLAGVGLAALLGGGRRRRAGRASVA